MSEPGLGHDVEVEARRAIEAVVMAATEPVDPAVLAQLIEVPTARVEELCDELAAEYEREGRGFVLVRIAGGYRFQTHPEAAAYVERFVLDAQHARLSGPALETLAIVAYKQPISRAQVSAIRGVNVDATLRTLVARGYVEEVGHDHSPGNPALFATTSLFLERLGIDSLADLPSLGDFIPDANVVETLERGLRLPGETPVALDEDAEDDEDEDGDVDPVDDVDAIDGSVADVAPIVGELQAGLDDDD
jgi:segregation and condensation protein B